MMDVRGKLVELLDNNFGYVDEVRAEVLADLLIRNGVTIIEEEPEKTNRGCAYGGKLE